MSTLDTVLDDLAAESAQLDNWVATLTPDQSQALANTLQSKASRIKIGCAIDHFSAP